MPYSEAGKLDYFVTIVFMIVFLWSFFIYPNMQIYIAPIVLIYEWFVITVLPGRTRLREVDKKILLFKLKLAVRKKIEEGIQDYYRWKNKD
jgi:hypothetical protein